MNNEPLHINPETGEILLSGNQHTIQEIKHSKIKALKLLKLQIANIHREAEGMGVCEKAEFTQNMKYTLHNMNAKAETRAIKRAIDLLFGSVVNYFVINYLEKHT